MPEIIVVHEVPRGKGGDPLLIAPPALSNRIRDAAKWCQQTEYKFVRAAILDRLDDVEALMAGWDFEDCSIENPAFDVKVAIVPANEEGGD